MEGRARLKSSSRPAPAGHGPDGSTRGPPRERRIRRRASPDVASVRFSVETTRRSENLASSRRSCYRAGFTTFFWNPRLVPPVNTAPEDLGHDLAGNLQRRAASVRGQIELDSRCFWGLLTARARGTFTSRPARTQPGPSTAPRRARGFRRDAPVPI